MSIESLRRRFLARQRIANGDGKKQTTIKNPAVGISVRIEGVPVDYTREELDKEGANSGTVANTKGVVDGRDVSTKTPHIGSQAVAMIADVFTNPEDCDDDGNVKGEKRGDSEGEVGADGKRETAKEKKARLAREAAAAGATA